jgi:hypothetical protein
MSIWSTSSITNVNVGTSANDGSGDDIRDAFIKVDTNFGNISQWLSSTYVQFQNANINGTLQAPWANVTNANVGTIRNSTGDLNIASTLLPTVDGIYDLGSPTRQFKTIYFQNQVQSGITSTVDAGIFKVHANASVGDIQDTGILGNVSSDYGGTKEYIFFGHQYTTNDFIYKTIGYDATLGNNIVDGGFYGNVHFGSAFLSNTTPSANVSTGALIVGGGAGIAGNLNISGNIVNNNANANVRVAGTMFAEGGYRVITTNIIGNYGNPYTGGIIAGNTVFLSSAVSTNANTGAVSIPYGGLGVFGNVVSGTGFVSPNFFGTIRTADQPFITSLGTLPTLNAVSGSFTSVGTTGLTTTGIVNLSGPTLTIASNTSIASFANIASGLIVGANAWVGGTATVVGNISTSGNASITNAVNIGTTLTVGNAVTIGSATTLTNNITGISSASAVTLDSFSATTYGSAKYLIQIVDTGVTPNKVQTAEMTLVHDRNGSSTLVYINTYGVVANQGSLGTFLGTYSSGAIRLQFTPSYTPTSMAIKVVRTVVTL